MKGKWWLAKFSLIICTAVTSSSSLFAKSYLSIISSVDKRGQQCEIENAEIEPNITGITIKCKDMITMGGVSSKEIVLTWPETSVKMDIKIGQEIWLEISAYRSRRYHSLWIVAHFGENLRNYATANVHMTGLKELKYFSYGRLKKERSFNAMATSERIDTAFSADSASDSGSESNSDS